MGEQQRYSVIAESKSRITDEYGVQGYINFKRVFEPMLKIINNVISNSNITSKIGTSVEPGIDLRVTNPISGLTYYSMSNDEVEAVFAKIIGKDLCYTNNAGLYIDTELCQVVIIPKMDNGTYQELEDKSNKLVFAFEEFELIVNKSGVIAVFAAGEPLYSNTDTISYQNFDDQMEIYDNNVMEMVLLY